MNKAQIDAKLISTVGQIPNKGLLAITIIGAIGFLYFGSDYIHFAGARSNFGYGSLFYAIADRAADAAFWKAGFTGAIAGIAFYTKSIIARQQ